MEESIRLVRITLMFFVLVLAALVSDNISAMQGHDQVVANQIGHISKSWAVVVGEMFQSYSEIVAVLIGSGLAVLLSRLEHRRQREEKLRERLLDAASSVVEAMDVMGSSLNQLDLKGREIIETECHCNQALKAVQVEACVDEYKRRAVVFLDRCKEFRTAGLRYQLLSQDAVHLRSALDSSKELIASIEVLLGLAANDATDAIEVVMPSLRSFHNELHLVEESIREELSLGK